MAKTVMITGASSGFGAATAKLFASRGWNVVATMRHPPSRTELAEFDNVLVTRLDVQYPATIGAAIQASLARFGSIDCLVNNAGFGLYGVFESIPHKKVLELFEVNTFGPMHVIRAVLPVFRENRSGVIINFSSGAGVVGLPMLSLYTASKFALEGYSESLSYELAPLGIMVKLIEPGGSLATAFVQRMGEETSAFDDPEDYHALLSASEGIFEKLAREATATAQDVAEIIYTAATDQSDRLRYVATDDIRQLVDLRRQTSESEYMAQMRRRFSLKSTNKDERGESQIGLYGRARSNAAPFGSNRACGAVVPRPASSDGHPTQPNRALRRPAST